MDVKHQIQLRNNGDLRIPLYVNTHSQLFVPYRAINNRNSASGDLRNSSLCTFKNKLRQVYLSLKNFANTQLVWLVNYCLLALILDNKIVIKSNFYVDVIKILLIPLGHLIRYMG